MSSGILVDISNLLKSKFGDEIVKSIKVYYDSDNPSEVIKLANHMLSGLIGEEMAYKLINKILEKYPDYKKLTIKSST